MSETIVVTKLAVAIPVSESTPELRKIFPSIICDLYRRSVEEDLMRLSFPGCEFMNFSFFAQFAAHPNAHLVIGRAINPRTGNEETCGYAFLYQQNGVAPEMNATVGYCFFREFWGQEEIVTISKQAHEYWFRSGFKALYGTALRSNRLAQRFDKLVGCREIGVLPSYFSVGGKLQDGVSFVLTRPESGG